MKTLKTADLHNNLLKKGIYIDSSNKFAFEEFDYYQTINAYKYLFTTGYENIDQIDANIRGNNQQKINEYVKYYDIANYKNPNDLISQIHKSISVKYGLHFSNSNIHVLNNIKKIKYIRHIYDTRTNFDDFVRMFLLEHEFRNVLIKYTLFIEEKIKKIFISKLNDMGEDADCLVNIKKYDFSGKRKTHSINSLGNIIKMYNNKNSKPISRKMRQEICVPYWIIINEMTMNQTLKTIKNLSPNLRNTILQQLINEMANLNIDIFDKTLSKGQIKDNRKTINSFLIILEYIGDFRNSLAHNQPIYLYNIKNQFPNLTYIKPILQRKTFVNNKYRRKITHIQQQQYINSNLTSKLETIFKTDSFNARRKGINIDLSWIVYSINRIICVLLPNNKMAYEIRQIFKKYNLFLKYQENEFADFDSIHVLLSKITNDIELVDKNTNVNAYNETIDDIKKQSSKILKNTLTSSFAPFLFEKTYTHYTNIDKIFLINYLK